MNKAIMVRRRNYETALIAVKQVSGPTALRWSCHHRVETSDIEAWVPTQNGLVPIAQTRSIDGVSARANAELIIRAVNEYQKLQPVMVELVAALEQCLAADGLNWETEQEADIVCRKAKRVLGEFKQA